MRIAPALHVGASFLACLGGQAKHLWIVLSDPSKNGGDVVIVNITTMNQESDKTCVLTVGDHPFVRHDSIVNFRDAMCCSATNLRNAMKNEALADVITPKSLVAATVMKRILTAAATAPSLKRKFKQMI